MVFAEKLSATENATYYISPAIILAYYSISSLLSICLLQNHEKRAPKALSKAVLGAMLAILLTYVAETALQLTYTFTHETLQATKSGNVGLPSCCSRPHLACYSEIL